MKKHLPSTAVLVALLLAFCLHALALENRAVDTVETSPSADGTAALELVQTSASLIADDAASSPQVSAIESSAQQPPTTATIENTLYLSVVPVLNALYPEVKTDLTDGHLSATGDSLRLEASADTAYFMVNDRYFYVPHLVVLQEGALMLPAETLAEALGCSLTTNEQDCTLTLVKSGQPAAAGAYEEEDLYWLSRAIYSESGNQPMKGRIAVGTVILNRVAHEAFPNTIKDVIFAPGQFSPVSNGTIYREPDEESVIAAKLCLDGVREAGESLYFNVTSMVSWADQSRTLYCTIGDHNFYL